jgi:hypothetical protein
MTDQLALHVKRSSVEPNENHFELAFSPKNTALRRHQRTPAAFLLFIWWGVSASPKKTTRSTSLHLSDFGCLLGNEAVFFDLFGIVSVQIELGLLKRRDLCKLIGLPNHPL